MPLVMTPAAQQTPQASTPLASLIPAGMAFTAEGSGGPSAARARKQAPMVLPLPSTLGQLLRGGLVLEGLHEGFGCQSEVDLANLRAFALALASWRFQMARGAVVWVQQGPDVQLSLALPAFGLELNRFVSVRTSADRDALWSAEELCESQGVAALLVEVNRFDLLASRRLQLRLEQVAAANARAKMPPPLLFVLRVPRYGKKPLDTPSASSTRWRISPSASLLAQEASEQDWTWRWRLELFRNKGGEDRGIFDLEWCCATHRFAVVPPLAG